MHLIVFVRGTKRVHGDVHCEANGVFTLKFPARNDGSLPRRGVWVACERATQVVLAQENLGVRSARDCIERGRSLDPAYGALKKIERAKKYVLPAERRWGPIGQHTCEFASRGATEIAQLSVRTGRSIVDEEQTSE
jgi:hypothetical protein